MGTAVYVAVCVLWLGGLYLLTTWSETTSATWAAAAITVAAGVAIGRWWVLLVPVVVAVPFLLGSLIGGAEGDSDGTSGWTWAIVIALWASAFAALLALGTGLRRLVHRERRRQRGAAPGSS